MPLPAGLSTVTVSGTVARPGDGPGPVGRITFTPDTPQIRTTAGKTMLAGPVTAVPNSSGQFTITLLAPDSAGISPTGWGYTVAILIAGSDPIVLHAALTKNNPSVKLADLILNA